MNEGLIHRPRFDRLPSQIAVLGIALQQSLSFEEAADARCESLGQSGELSTRRRLHPAQSGRSTYTLSRNNMWKCMLRLAPSDYLPA